MFAPPPAILEGSQKQQQTKRLIWLRDSCIQSHSPKLRTGERKEEFSRVSFEHDGGSCRGGFQTRPRPAFTVYPLIRDLSTNFQFAADPGNSVAASMWHEGGFETRPYKRPACAMPPVLGLRERLRQMRF